MKVLAVRYFVVVKRDLPNNFAFSTREAILWQSNQMAHALDFLKAIPIAGLNQNLVPRKFRAILQYCLGIPLFPKDSVCPCCSCIMDIFGDHAMHCANQVGVKFRHDLVCDVVIDICYKAVVVDRKEVSLGFLDDENGLKPANILVYNWENGQDTCHDVIGVSPFAGDGLRSSTPGRAISAAISRKCTKYLYKCTTHGYGFGVLSFSTLGELGDDFIVFLNRLKNCLSNYDANYKI